MPPNQKFSPSVWLLSAVMLTVLLRPLAAADWPQWRGPARNGISAETEWTHQWPASGPPIVWRASVGTGFSSVAVADGRVFTLGNEANHDTVFCLDAETGAIGWQHRYAAPLEDKFFEGGPTATPTVDGESVFTLGRQGELFCFDAATGAIRWQQQIAESAERRVPGWGFAASPVVHGDTLLLGVGEAGTALDKRSGQLLWTSADQEAGYATPLLLRRDGRWLALIASGKYFHAVDMASGEELWRVRWLTRFGCNAADPIVDGDQLLLSSGYNRGAALWRLTDGEPEVVWKNKELQSQFSSAVLLDGYVYGVDGDTTGERQLKCLKFASGETQWAVDGLGSASLMAAGDRLIVLSEQGELIVARASPAAFEPLARAAVLAGKSWTAPVLAHGRVYCRSADGEVACVDLRGSTP